MKISLDTDVESALIARGRQRALIEGRGPKVTDLLLNPHRFGSGGDPYWGNVVSLLHFEGANGSTTFTDQRGKTWTPAGNAQISTAQAKYGSASGVFDGANDNISCASHADFGFGTGDWTVECWVRRGAAAAQVIWDNRTTGAGSEALTAFFDSAGNLCYFDSSTKTGSGATAAVGSWTHVAWSRSSGTIRMFVGGTQVFSGALSTNMGTSRPMKIAEDVTGGSDFNGYIDEFRVTKGVGRYTASFTPPTAAFPDS